MRGVWHSDAPHTLGLRRACGERLRSRSGTEELDQLAPCRLIKLHSTQNLSFARAGLEPVANRDDRFGGFELVHALLAIDHAPTLLGTACINSASAALKLRSPGAAPL
jgi:hypothetical protein